MIIYLTQGKIALVSDIDYVYLNQWKWYCKKGYAARSDRKNKCTIFMHHVILKRMDLKNLKETDHKDGNKLNNQRKNLRPATRLQNCRNKGQSSHNTSGYKGVLWQKDKLKWRVRLGMSGKQRHLGYSDNLRDAALMYDKAAIEHFGKFARPNNLRKQ